MSAFRDTKLFKSIKPYGNVALQQYHNRFVGRKFNQPTIVFESFAGKFINDSPYAIYLELKKQRPDWNLIWSVNKNQISTAKELNLKYVRRLRRKWAKTMAMADGWVSNSRMIGWLKKTDDTYYLQTWHGTPLKRLGLDIENVVMPGTTTARYRGSFLTEVEKWDGLISPNKYSTDIFKRAFDYKKEILEIGYPRNDALYQGHSQDEINQLKRKLGLPLDKKIILYTPTYRDEQNQGQGKYQFELPLNLEKLKAEFGDQIYFVFRMHYLISEKIKADQLIGFAKDLSKYQNINDLYLVSDALLTDYSSTMFDYAILKRPIILYFNDEDQYKQSRDFYIDKQDLPVKPVNNETGLINSINKLIGTDFQIDKKQLDFNKEFVIDTKGQSAKKAVNDILKHVEKIKNG